MKKAFLGKKGFTLMEMVISVALLGLFTGMVASLTAPIVRVYTASVEESQLESMSNSVLSEIEGEFRFSVADDAVFVVATNSVEFKTTRGIIAYTFIDTADGTYLEKRLGSKESAQAVHTTLFAESFFGGYTVTAAFEKNVPSANWCKMTLEYRDKSGNLVKTYQANMRRWATENE